MQVLLFQQVEECPLVIINTVEMSSMVQQRLDHCRLGWLIESSRMQSTVTVLCTEVQWLMPRTNI